VPLPDAVDDVVVVGFEDAAMLLAPEPHIPVNPDVASIPEVVDAPDVVDIADDDIPDDVDGLPGVTAVAGVVVPPAIPPPSYVVGDPNVPSGEVATVEHAAPLLALGTVIVPIKPLGTVLTPGDAFSGKPLGPTDSPGTIPNEEVTPGEGVAMVIPACAKAALWQKDEDPQIASTAAKAMTFFFIMIAHIEKNY
jgi:hypothetical protein